MALKLSTRPFWQARFSQNLPLSPSRIRGGGAVRHFSAEIASHPSNRVQIYISRSSDPYLNLSIEHFLLQKSGPDSVVLFLYTNRPCVVIGRNQNPWVEVNLGLINRPGVLALLRSEAAALRRRKSREWESEIDIGQGKNGESENGHDDDGVLLVRRRSGGGTVFHDAGNVNYSVICPPASFDRDKHAEMVVRALHRLGVRSTRVNERHDIVLDVSSTSSSSSSRSSSSSNKPDNTDGTSIKTFKISGSAYKLTRQRSLHHGTCLLSSPNLPFIGRFLRSPAAPYVKARGVESVRSAVRNVSRDPNHNKNDNDGCERREKITNTAFEDAVVAEFGAMYGNVDAEVVGPAEVAGVPEIEKGVAELKSLDWIYTQTPQFTFSTHATESDPRPRPALPPSLPPEFRAAMTVRHGQITEVGGTGLPESLTSTLLHEVDDWRSRTTSEPVGKWLNGLFGARGRPGEP
ncbi:Uu.00g064350.m01.CDS01 [Anthostomella pinea]|uniref:Putative lipoate-protein ligase A n=1 Tax=Anthostomella pinea TaxID=933095 RepID=A0AAI8VU61_9PEZI|nr:Uu.00g064350.m01.CDS01 [Anthostomella pinea]